MNRLIAITRAVSPSLGDCELTHLSRIPLDVERARAQHAAYEATLTELGCEVVQLPGDAAFPDCVFIEDTAVVVDEVAVIARPGAESRRGETTRVAEALSPWRDLARIEAPGLLDGGDVLILDRLVYVGMSSRTNPAGAAQLEAILSPHDYRVRPVEINDCLHLKTAASAVNRETLLINPDWCDAHAFTDCEVLQVDPDEPTAANVLNVNGTIIMPEAFVATRQRLADAGFKTVTVPADELAKAEGGVSCCSLVFSP
jgi:dimethylargininase